MVTEDPRVSNPERTRELRRRPRGSCLSWQAAAILVAGGLILLLVLRFCADDSVIAALIPGGASAGLLDLATGNSAA